MGEILEWDKQLFLWLNGFHTPWLDPVMLLITRTELWLPLYILLAYLIFKNYGKEGWLVLAGAALTILIADRVTSGLMKPFFARLRPSHEPSLQHVIHTVGGYKGGLHGFASSHAANTFGIAFLIWLVFRDIYKWVSLIFLWAALMTYTRIYLGVHYPGDIIVGLFIGILSAFIGFRFYRWLKSIRDKRTNTV